MKVLKFGGSSIATVERVDNVLNIIATEVHSQPAARAVILSAFGGVTDDLVEVSKLAANSDQSYRELLSSIQDRNINALKHFVKAADQSAPMLQIKLWCNDLENVLNGVFLVGELSPRCLDFVMSFGELFSTYIVSQALVQKNIEAEFLDSRKILVADDTFNNATIDLNASYKKIKTHFDNNNTLQVVTGFIAATTNGDTVTFGRGGSDYTASLIAAGINAQEVEIWTDVDGMMTADPRKVPKAFSQPYVSYAEAMELSHFGAKVIFPPTMQPALDQQIPIRIRNSFQPNYEGTLVTSTDKNTLNTVTGISSIATVSLIRVQGSGMVGVAGVSSRLFGALAAKEISVILITQASSEHTICFAVKPEYSTLAVQCLETEFALELHANLIDQIIIENDLSIVSVVGERMRQLPGVAAKIFGALGKNGINIVAIAQGSSELNISCVIQKHDEVKALKTLHDEFFFPNMKVINLFLVGPGLIGGALLKQIQEHSQCLLEEHDHEIRIIGLCNSRNMIFDEDGLSLEAYQEQLASGVDYKDITQFIDKMIEYNLPNSVFVDCTASETIAATYGQILRASISIVTPNKKAQSDQQQVYQELKYLANRRGIHFLFETSVGAGLPVISTINDLLKSGDQIIKIEAVLSGTLSYIFNTFDENHSFSEVVTQARAAGFTEPDPRDDLNGLDVARKILILARELGGNLEIDDIDVENLVPSECRKTETVEEFLDLLQKHDHDFETRRTAATSHNARLCYIAKYEANRAEVKLCEVDHEHPFYNLSGSDNIISITSNRYQQRPLVVKGPGAGAEVTAAGVFADIIRLAN